MVLINCYHVRGHTENNANCMRARTQKNRINIYVRYVRLREFVCV